MHQAERDQAVDRLQRVDRVAAGDGNARRRAYRLAAFQDLLDGTNTDLV
jgi:hypothetical protein